MSRILIVARGGDTTPLVIGTELVRRGHDVRVLDHADRYAAVNGAGLGFAAYAHAAALSPAADIPENRFLAARVALALDPGAGVDVRAELARRRPDVVLVDATCLAAVREAERSGIPTAVLVPTLYRFLAERWATGPLGLASRLRRLRPATLWGRAARVLVATDPDLDGPLPAGAVHTGAVTGRLRPPAREPDALVAVDLGTGAYPGRTELLQRVLDALDGLDGTAVVGIGDGVDGEVLRVPDGVRLHRRLDHADVLSRAHLLIGHGGHATTVRALANDLPVLVLPGHPQLVHPMIGAAVEASGAGRALSPGSPPAEIAAAVTALLGDGPHRGAAAAVGARIRSRDGAGAAADELESLVRT
ncbi:glycosyltransferase [Pseudonocardia abyssalis]|uniref:Glycosyl transferase n=1 Tax=Pseudonocardia abyssalis TaxID=2792008 RepID=A0ABS6V1X7_9PSEU|nr:nucleotide disphospho-sugar-binding domain-containing protein [Pseudonocardia abyssalis]MBW0118461.1 glycosyl transferase [Pseudonocardia abyssalis]MBW0138514.1 glycosyl transferase [Pseudonocardia abyssalis]